MRAQVCPNGSWSTAERNALIVTFQAYRYHGYMVRGIQMQSQQTARNQQQQFSRRRSPVPQRARMGAQVRR